jgi:hypothetical protein
VRHSLADTLPPISCRNGDVATITIAPDGKSLQVEDKHEPDADVPVYDSHMLTSEEVFDEDGEILEGEDVKL